MRGGPVKIDIAWKLNELSAARSRLYQRRLLEVNNVFVGIRIIRWKALDEIYKMYMLYVLLHRSDLNISAKLCQTCSHFSAKKIP